MFVQKSLPQKSLPQRSLPREVHVLLCVVLLLLGFVLTASGCSRDSLDGITLERSASAQAPPAPVSQEVEALAPRTIRLPSGQPGSLTVAVISDLNASYGSRWYPEPVHKAVDRLIEIKPDVVLSAGDMVAGQQPGLDYPGMWRAFHDAVSDRLFDAGIPFAPSPGNHDASGYPQYENERGWYEHAWQWRRPAVEFVDDQHYPFRYAFTVGNALFIALDATVARPLPDEQRLWLENVLTENSHVDARIVFGHLPIYPFAEGRRWDILDDVSLERLLNDHDVDIYVSGHHQAYYSGRRGDLRMVSTGCLGNGVRRLLGQAAESHRTIVLLNIDRSGNLSVKALTGDDFRREIPLSSLPPTIGERRRIVFREDMSGVLDITGMQTVDIDQLEQELRGRVFNDAIAPAKPH